MVKRSWLLAALVLFLVGCAPGAGPAPTPALGDLWTRSTDDMATVYVPAGEFVMGSPGGDPTAHDEIPMHTVRLDAFWIDRTEVTNAQYRRCVEAGDCIAPARCQEGQATYNDPAMLDHPVVCTNWDMAAAYCAWAGGRLPTEAQWEHAARGPASLTFPWGETFDGSLLNSCDADCELEWHDSAFEDGYPEAAPVGSFPAGASWCGALDMVGNVWEWVNDWYGEGYYSESPSRNPAGPDAGELRVRRGGSWADRPPWRVRGAFREGIDPTTRTSDGGFRCVIPTR